MVPKALVTVCLACSFDNLGLTYLVIYASRVRGIRWRCNSFAVADMGGTNSDRLPVSLRCRTCIVNQAFCPLMKTADDNQQVYVISPPIAELKNVLISCLTQGVKRTNLELSVQPYRSRYKSNSSLDHRVDKGFTLPMFRR